MTETVKVEYKGEHLFSGTRVPTPNMFWSGVKIAPEFDTDKVIEKLREIRSTDRVYFERYGHADTVHLAPVYDVTPDDSLGL